MSLKIVKSSSCLIVGWNSVSLIGLHQHVSFRSFIWSARAPVKGESRLTNEIDQWEHNQFPQLNHASDLTVKVGLQLWAMLQKSLSNCISISRVLVNAPPFSVDIHTFDQILCHFEIFNIFDSYFLRPTKILRTSQVIFNRRAFAWDYMPTGKTK